MGALVAPAQPVFSSLTKLRIDECNKMRIQLSGVPNIEVIDISRCKETEEIFEHEGTTSLTLHKLKTLWLEKLPRLRKVGIQSRFPNLEEIRISWCKEIEEIFGDEGTSSLSLPKLKTLSLQDLPRLRKVGILLSGVPNLEWIHVTKCGEIDVFDDEGKRSLALPKLKRLDLEEFPKLKSLCKGTTIICNSIQVISITECPRLMNRLPVDVDLAVPKLNPELWESLMSDDPNLSRFFSEG